MFTRAIVREPGVDFAQGITTTAGPAPDFELTMRQHRAYVDCLRDLGLNVTVLPATPGFPDACFVEDTAVVTAEMAVITRPGADARRGEAAQMAPDLAVHRTLEYITEPGTLDGGDILQVDRHFFIGQSDRTNAEGAAQLASILSRYGYSSDIIPVAAGLHLKSSLNYVGANTMLVTRDFAEHPAIRDFKIMVCPDGEEYAANTLRINDTLITPTGYPRTRAMLDGLGMPVVELDTSEYRKMDGGLTCLSLRF